MLTSKSQQPLATGTVFLNGPKILGFALQPNSIGRNNAIFAFLMGALPAVGGSIISVMLYSAFVWAIVSLAFARFEFRMTRSDRLLAWTFTVFAALILFTALIGSNRSEIPQSTVWLLAFLSPWVIVSRLRASEGVDLLRVYIFGAAAGAVGAALFASIQGGFLGIRAEGGAGNPSVFAIMSLCLMGIGGLNVAMTPRPRQSLAICAVVAGTVAVVMSLTRGVGLAMFPVLALLAIFAPTRWRSVLGRPSSLVVLFIAGVALYYVRHLLNLRWNGTIQEVQSIISGYSSPNIGDRLRLWNASWEAWFKSPILGYGIQNRMASLAPELAKDGLPINGYRHPHNGFLSFALDGGILTLSALLAVLCVPVVIAWRAPRDQTYRIRLFLALIVSTTYAVCGLTQIMFKHDIMDSFFVFCAMLIAASISQPTLGKT